MASDRMDSMRLELRRGLLVSAVLAALRVEQYGYSLRKVLAEAGLDIEEGTLYPLIRRLEEYGLLQSRWSEGEGRRRRYYHISAEGEEVLTTLAQEWRALHAALQNLMGE
jgi:PadR family transcriptional regulator, regulatory protein PadR